MSQTLNINDKLILVDYYVHNNSRHTSSSKVGELTYKYHDQIKEILNSATDDENKYEINEAEIERFYEAGKKMAQEKTGYEGTKAQKAGQIARTAADGTSAVASTAINSVSTLAANSAVGTAVNTAGQKVADLGGALCGKIGAKKVASKAAAEATEKALEKGATVEAAKKAGVEAGTAAGKDALKEGASKNSAGGNKAWVIAAPLEAATTIAYYAKKPNKTQKEACDELQNVMDESTASLYESQEDMEMMKENLESCVQEADEAQEIANDDIMDAKTDYDGHARVRRAIEQKRNSGIKLSDSEIAMYKMASEAMAETGSKIQETESEANENVTAIQDDMGTYQEGYDAAAENMTNIEGITDYAEGIDKSTQTMCIVESAAQGLNAGSGALTAVQAGKFAASGGIYTAWAWAWVAMAVGATAGSGIATGQQIGYAKAVGTEIGKREVTQEVNDATSDIYNTEVENYEVMMDGVGELSIDQPDDISAPTNTTIANNNIPKEEAKDTKTVNTEDKKDDKKVDKNIK